MNFSVKLLLCILMSIFMSTTCPIKEDENNHLKIVFYNNSDRDIYLGYKPPIIEEQPIQKIGGDALKYNKKIKAYRADDRILDLESFTWEHLFNDYLPKITGKLNVYVFDAEKLEAEDTDTISALQYVYRLRLDDLQRMNWAIKYPPEDDFDNPTH